MSNLPDDTIESGTAPPEYSKPLSSTDPPPSYESIYGRIKEAKRKSDGKGQYLKNVCSIFVSTIGFTILLGILLAIPITMIVIGSLNLNKCPVERFIPIWLVVAGSVGAFQLLTSLCDNVNEKKKSSNAEANSDDSEKQGNRCCATLNSIIGCFNFAWFIAGCVWVYRNYPPNTSNSLLNYCDHTTYYLAFWLLTSVFIIMAFFLSCCCCILFCVAASD